MKELGYKLSKRVLFPFSIFFIIEQFYPKISTHVWSDISGLVPSIGELAKFAALAGLASILGEEVIKDSLMPPFRDIVRNIVLPEMKIELNSFRDMLAKGLWEKGIIFREEVMEKEFPEPEMPNEEPDLKKAKQLLVDGDLTKAIAALSELTKTKPKYSRYLLCALLSSPRVVVWRSGQELLPAAGRVAHYLRLAYNYWLKGDLSNAIAVTEAGYKRLGEGENKESQEDLDKLGNSLAYYYAEARLVEKQDQARELSEDIVARRSHKKDESLGSALATRGYVKISFSRSKEEIESGIKDCEDARRLGARDDLYFRHLARAQERLLSLGSF